MEGLLLAAALADLRPRLPLAHVGWRFLDAATIVLPFAPAANGALWLSLRPPDPYLAVAPANAAPAVPLTPFQAQLRARAGGPLVTVEQAALDRRVRLRFGPGEGFVPTDPVELEVELTGRHANAVLCDERDVILGVLREVGAGVNRHRQLLPGLRYRPPPPYRKLDPRTAPRDAIAASLVGRSIASAHRQVDGIGPRLTAAWAQRAALDPQAVLDGDALAAALDALAAVVTDPLAAVTGVVPSDPAEARRAEAHERERAAARARLEDRLALTRTRLADTERAADAAEAVTVLRAEADLLLARAHLVARGASQATLEGFDGAPVTLTLDPELDAAANARRRYERARKREARAERALERFERSHAELERLEAALASIDTADPTLLAELAPPAPAPRDRRRSPPGLRVRDPRGFEVVIGRTARENDLVTFRVARSEDVWLHAQGYHGAHVVVRAEGREVPFETVLFAAELAAGHSEAGQSDNVAVDYTSRKDVWRSKGMPAGAVHYARQRTVFVTPRRRSEVDEERRGSTGRIAG